MSTPTQPTPGESLADLLARVRTSLERDGDQPVAVPAPPALDDTLVRLATADDDLPTLFADKATTVGMQVHRTTLADAPAELTRRLVEADAKRAAVQPDALEVMDIDAVLDAQGVTRVALTSDAGTPGTPRSAANPMDPQYDADVGITGVQAALAETGTLVCTTGRSASGGRSRGPSLVPPIHIALVRASDIVPDMFDYMARLQNHAPADLPASQAFITGPSKTADIEGVLVTGVHGPREVHILLITDA
jgi:L-lactate dehydrogenase complex protein LldG